MARCLTALVAALAAPLLCAEDLRVDSARLHRPADGPPRLELDVSWQSAWRNARNHDAAWVFARYRGRSGWAPLRLQPGSSTIEPGGDALAARVVVPADGAGAFVSAAREHRGPVEWTLSLLVDVSSLPRERAGESVEIAAFGLEMVHVPAGPVWIGDPDPAARNFGGFATVDSTGTERPLRIADESPIEVGDGVDQLRYRAEQPEYQGDRRGPIPVAFPKGTRAFYMMKYELRQGEYTAFLNDLSDNATAFRANFGGRAYRSHRGTIRLEGERYAAERPQRPCNYISWDDGCAFADWACLRPMTEFEYTKACRGSDEPTGHEFPWNTDDKEGLARFVDPTGDLVLADGLRESELSDANRARFGASHFWVMDLAGSVWERVVTVGHPLGRSFTGSHGDGVLTGHGAATNRDWPRGDEGPGGYGYRGGGYYDSEHAVTEFNPHSPIAYRRFGAWGGAPRYMAYGYRCVRAAPSDG